ncbi:hypothetical protein PCIT_b1001 [Pseudoalteromonas citrea]|uniref:Uncharacterized protein n=2 Tax=Pseudoalteromonas citrea TaxID=43655 RepID=A0AAD4AFF5_9GAMM|nr:hypothetical protein [Pseudoalteromonas citrea]KAF7764902.1 hypothetical protein PCIT_b1001 [Pseudoalteromonas citrea]
MKKLIKIGTLVLSTFMGSQAFAASMECTIGDPQYNRDYNNYTCYTVEFGSTYAQTTFKIVGNKAISHVIWGDAAANCGFSNSASCTVLTSANKVHAATAKVLYQDGSWETVWATSLFNNI